MRPYNMVYRLPPTPAKRYIATAKASEGSWIFVGYSREFLLERRVRDARMLAVGGGTVQVWRDIITTQVLGKDADA